jgi:hypothetical protein
MALAKPQRTESITREILKVEKTKYKRKGKPSPERRNVVIGQAIDSFDKCHLVYALSIFMRGESYFAKNMDFISHHSLRGS